MCGVEVASTGAPFEHSNALTVLGGKIAKEAYEPDLVIDLAKHELLQFEDAFADYITFNSGLDDIFAVSQLFRQSSSRVDYQLSGRGDV